MRIGLPGRSSRDQEEQQFVLEDRELDETDRDRDEERLIDGSGSQGAGGSTRPRYSLDNDDDEGESELSEKAYKHVRELPAYEDLRDARVAIPGYKAIASGLVLLACIGYLFAWALTLLTRHGGQPTKVTVVLMVSDGYGPASATLAREYLQYLVSVDHDSVQPGGRWASLVPLDGPKDYGLLLPLDSMLVGTSRTRSADSLITDSAAGATAFSAGEKTFNGGIAVEPVNRDPLGTVLEAAKHQGYLTGLAVTSRITHATPAAFYAHVPDRDMEDRIAEQMVSQAHPLGQQVDIAFGGGLCFFLPNTSTTSCRTDDKDLVAAAQDTRRNKNPRYSVITTRKEFDDIPDTAASIGTIGLFNRDHMQYEVDRVASSAIEAEREPSLAVMAQKTLNILRDAAHQQGAPGSFLLVEGSRIDMAAHSQDPVGHVHEILAYQEAVLAIKKLVTDMNAAGSPAILVSVSDHSTGGMTLGRQLDQDTYPVYAWYPGPLANGTQSTIFTAMYIQDRSSTIDVEGLREILATQLGVLDPDQGELAGVLKDKENYWQLHLALGSMVSRRAQIGWSTQGHSGEDVFLYAWPQTAAVLRTLAGARENTEIGAFIADAMKLNLPGITSALRHNLRSWYNSTSPKLDGFSIDRGHSTDELLHYHGEHRH